MNLRKTILILLTCVMIPGCYTAWEVTPYEPTYPTNVVVVDGGSYWYGGAWWYGYHGMWHRHRVQVWQPSHQHNYQVTPRHERRPEGERRVQSPAPKQSQGRTHGNRR